MNYRHAYHAGNFADVFKHIILIALTKSFMHKNTAICYLDTHAGVGYYDLFSNAAQKSKEYQNGIEKIIAQKDHPPLVKDYLQCVRKINNTAELRFYPGSPYFVKEFLRPIDRMILSELHPQDYELLKRNIAHGRQVSIHCQDGYQCLKAFLPPKERRGFVLIDPPYEQPNEFNQLTQKLAEALKQWETGVYAIWYPIKNNAAVKRFQHDLKSKINRPLLCAEISILPDDIGQQLHGCGLIIINPPWQLEQQLKEIIPWIWNALSINSQGHYQINT